MKTRESLRLALGFQTSLVKQEALDELLTPQRALSDRLWDDDRMRPEVRERLLQIALDFHAHLELPFEPEEVILTGSLANFTWTRYSDLDVHLLYDFGELDDAEADLVRALLRSETMRWNDAHAIRVRGHEVELYPQDIAEPHFATGLYSLSRDEWIRTPTPQQAQATRPEVEEKVARIRHAIASASEADDPLDRLKRVKEKIRLMRKCGLETGGEYSVENLAFKVLRTEDDLEALRSEIRVLEDQALSLNGNGA